MSTVADSAAGGQTTAAPDALSVDHINVTYRVRGHPLLVVRDVSFKVGRGESYGLVGESGCGKSTIALAVVRYLARNGTVSEGGISIDGRDVLAMGQGDLRRLRQNTVSMVYQEPGRALNPTLRVGRQVAEVFEIAGDDRAKALDRSREMLEKVRISDPGGVMNRYPHQLSGGMLQRVVIAMALASEPALLILDEPTTALDATVEAEVLDLISALRDEFGTSLMFISHNLGVIAKMCDRVGVLYAGEMIEEGPAREVFHDPRHPYTVGLLRCIPRRDTLKAHGTLDTIPGFLPTPGALEQGCIFADRCGLVEQRCRDESPPPYDAGPGRRSRCHFHERAQTLPRVVKAEPERAARAKSNGEQLISATAVSKTFRIGGRDDSRPGRRRPRTAKRRDAGAGRRVGERQDDDGPRAARADRARRGRDDRPRGQAAARAWLRSARASRRRRCRSCSRIPTRRSTAVTRSGGCCRARCQSSAATEATRSTGACRS